MQPNLESTYTNLDVATKDLIEKNHLDMLRIWARLIDEVEANFSVISPLSNSQQQFNNIKEHYQRLMSLITSINIAENANSYADFQNQFNNFQSQYYEQLINLKKSIQAITNDLSDIDSLKKVVSDAKKQRLEFEKSFSESLQKQSAGSQRTMAAYFQKRLADLKKDKDTDPKEWSQRRSNWLKVLLLTLVALGFIYVALIAFKLIEGYELAVLFFKFAILAAVYAQYHFMTKNYHIYADLVAKYEHLSVIANTMTDFISAAFEDEQLKEAVLSNAAKTLFSEVNTGHSKQAEKEASVFENIINQIPRNN